MVPVVLLSTWVSQGDDTFLLEMVDVSLITASRPCNANRLQRKDKGRRGYVQSSNSKFPEETFQR